MIKATQSCISFWLFCVLLMNRINTTPIQSVKGIHVILPNIPLSQHGQLDLAFLMDTTGSMTSYINSAKQNIREIVEEIVATSKSDVRLALIEYRDHSPEDKTFVTRKNDFTSSVSIMKSWLNVARARGGGDRPEAVADAMYQATKLSWRQDATKMCVMISDAPPHGLVPSEDTSFPYGSPNGHDPMQIARDLAQKGVTLYIIGVEPPVVPYKDFFMGLAHLTGGQYVPLSVPRLLVNVITGGALEELSLQRFQEEVQQEIEKAYGGGGGGGGIGGGGDGPINKDQIANSVYQRLQKSGAKSKQLVKNNNAIEGPSANAKLLASKYSMAEVRKVFKKGITPRTLGGFGGIRGGGGGGFGSKSGGDGVGSEGGGGGGGGGVGGLSIPNSSASDIYSAKESGITLEQINRLVERKTARFTFL